MRRVIVKSALNNRFDFFERISDLNADFDDPYWQHDRVFVPKNYETIPDCPRLILRTEIRDRSAPPVYKLSLRRHLSESDVDIVDLTLISNYSATATILLQLGFRHLIDIVRKRRALFLSKDTRFYLDAVEGLPGEYLKLETDLKDTSDPAAVKADLKESLKTLGQPPEDLIKKPYSSLLPLYQKKNL